MKTEIKRFINIVTEYVMAFFYPPHCCCCGDGVNVGELICEDCIEELERLRIKRPRVIKYKGRKYTLNAVYRYSSSNAASSVVVRAKFMGKLSATRFMGAMIAQKVSRLRSSYDVVTYVPMTHSSELKRGYNQCDYISHVVAKTLGLPQKALLIKLFKTQPQHNLLTTRARRLNLDGVFKAKREVKGKNILLIDDVVTSGTTLCECADTLYEAGAKSVTLMSFSMVRRSH